MRKQSRAQVALVALVLFLFGVGGLWALSNRLVQTSQNQAWSPLAVTSSVGVSRLYDDFMTDTVLMHVKNQDTRTIVIRGVKASGVSQDVWYGAESAGNWGHPEVNGNGCDPEHNAAKQCAISLAPGAEIAIQVKVDNGALCNRDFTEEPYSPPSINSVRKTAGSAAVFYYQYATSNPVEQIANALIGGKAAAAQPSSCSILTKSFGLTAQCFDYWMCTGDPYINQECMQRYETNKAHWCVKGGCGYSFVG